MSDKLTVDVDSRALYATLDRLGAIGEKHVKAAAKVTATPSRTRCGAASVATRPARRDRATTPRKASPSTSRTMGRGTSSTSTVRTCPNLPLWLEFGTKHMTASPFAFNSARLEEGAHDRRTRAAVQDAIDELGLGRP
jgi:hypothetical protein